MIWKFPFADAYLMVVSDASMRIAIEDAYSNKSDQSGYVLFRTDTYDGYTPEDVTQFMFR